MKLFNTIAALLICGSVFSQTKEKQFISKMETEYAVAELDETTQYYRMLSPLKQFVASYQAVELKSKTTHSDKASRFQERNQTIGFYSFEFLSKKSAKQAVDSLLQCFPNFCTQVPRYHEADGQFTPSIYIINDKTIHVIEIACEDENEKWHSVLIDFVNTFALPGSEIILSTCGKLEWTNKQNLTQ